MTRKIDIRDDQEFPEDNPEELRDNATSDAEKEQQDGEELKSKSETGGKPADSLKGTGSNLQELKKQLREVRKDRDHLRDQYLRGLAEFDNQQKRLKKEKEEFRKFILREFLLELLEVYDNLERALKIRPRSKEGNTLLSGVQMTYNQLITILGKYEVKEIDALNKPFDPNYHQALTKVEKAGIKEDTVIEVFQKGFTYHDRLLRPTLARVAVPKEDETGEKDG
jgi:molecular chaperone GrpE